MNVNRFSASGKLLLFGEYLVLRGAPAIVMPLSLGQALTISPNSSENILWECFEKGELWLNVEFSSALNIINTSDKKKALLVQQLLRLIQQKNPSLKITGLTFHFELDFGKRYGFGTSSTFLSLLGQWSDVNPYLLLEKSFGGSGFDIAAATAKKTFVYRAEGLHHNAKRSFSPIDLPSRITENLLFVYTGKKQKSRDEVKAFKEKPTSENELSEMNEIVDSVLSSNEIQSFEILVDRSEKLLSSILGIVPVKQQYFSDYPFSIKSLGAWGGDFIMATFRDEMKARNYFQKKGMQPLFNYQQLIKK